MDEASKRCLSATSKTKVPAWLISFHLQSTFLKPSLAHLIMLVV